ncbi:hypothetical protein OAC90_00225 [Planktomarina sp.]|nr:hypothetical protein [Planktomarina sp.]
MANEDTLWAIDRIDTSRYPTEIIKLTCLRKKWIREDSMQMSHALTRDQVDEKYFIFLNHKDAIKKAAARDKYQDKIIEEAERLQQQKVDEDAATMEFIRNTLHIAEEFQFAVFKTFMKELVFIDTKLVNKALFAVTLNKRFRGFLYKVENDSQFLEHVSANQMKEVLEMILSRR